MQGSSTSQATRTPPSEEKAGTQTVPLESIQNFGSIDTLCSDKTGTLTSGETKLEGFLDLSDHEAERVLLFGYLNSTYQTGIKSPLDEAILQHGKVDVSAYSKVDEIPFDFERRCLSVAVRHRDECLLITTRRRSSCLVFVQRAIHCAVAPASHSRSRRS